jgi:hypothetical protein
MCYLCTHTMLRMYLCFRVTGVRWQCDYVQYVQPRINAGMYGQCAVMHVCAANVQMWVWYCHNIMVCVCAIILAMACMVILMANGVCLCCIVCIMHVVRIYL